VKVLTVKATKSYVDTGINNPFTATQTALDLKAPLNSQHLQELFQESIKQWSD
jgi:hypothetical protein